MNLPWKALQANTYSRSSHHEPLYGLAAYFSSLVVFGLLLRV